MEIQEAFGIRLKELRTSAMLSQLDLAKLSGIERAQISKIENGTANVTLETMEKLSNAIKVPINELLNFRYQKVMH